MTTIKYESPASIATILTTELNGLADGSNKLSAALSNDAAGELFLYADFEITLATTSSRPTNARVDMYILIELDGSTYTYGSDSVNPADNMWVGSFIVDSGTLARVTHIRGIQLPPTDFKILLQNNLGVAMASSGNILKWTKYNLESL